MSPFLPFACLAIALASVLLHRDKPSTKWPLVSEWLSLVIVLICSAVAIIRFASPEQINPVITGLIAGALTAAAGALFDRYKPGEAAILGLGAAAGAFLLWLPAKSYGAAALGGIVGSSAAALVMANRTSVMTSFAVSTVCISVLTGSHAGGSFVLPAGGAILMGGAALVALAGQIATKAWPRIRMGWPVACCALIAGVAYLAGSRMSLEKGWITLCLAPVAALLCVWLQSETGESDVFGVLVSAALWLGLATAAFGLTRPFGVPLVLVAATATLIALNANTAIGSLGPLIAVVLAQAFREAHPDAARAIEVGQHYVLIGLTLGALVPLLPQEWISRVGTLGGARLSIARAFWFVLLALIPFFIGIYLAPKGMFGFATGLGLGGILTALRPTFRPLALAVAFGAAGFAMLELGWMGDLTELPRPDKMHWFLVGIIGVFAAAAILGALTLRRPTSSAQPEAA